MSYSQILVQLVSALAWPFTVIVIALIFRREVRRAANRLSSLSYGEFKFEFEKDLSAVEEEVKKLTSRGSVTRDKEVEEDKNALDSYDRLKRVAEISPRAAITEAWRDIEISTKKVADAYGISTLGHIAGGKAIN